MVVEFTSACTCAISAYHHQSCKFESRSWRGVLDTNLCDKVVSDLWQVVKFSPVSSTIKTDHYDIAEILLKVVLKRQNP